VVGHDGQPFKGVAIGRQHLGRHVFAFHADLVDVRRLVASRLFIAKSSPISLRIPVSSWRRDSRLESLVGFAGPFEFTPLRPGAIAFQATLPPSRIEP
jgi:hypothetical protein